MMTTTTPDQTVVGDDIRCTDGHEGILVGFAGTDNAPGSFGAFIAGLPVGAEIISVSGWVCRWTGAYVDHNGHKAAVLTRLRQSDPSRRTAATAKYVGQPALIHTCLANAWTATGRYTFADGAVVQMRHDRGHITPTCSVHSVVGLRRSFANAEARAAAWTELEEHVRTAH